MAIQGGNGSRPRRSALLVVLVVALLVLGALGLAERGRQPPAERPLPLPDLPVPATLVRGVVITVVVVLVVLLLLVVRGRSPHSQPPPPTTRGQWVVRVLLLALVVVLLSQDRLQDEVRDRLAAVTGRGEEAAAPATDTYSAPFWSWPVGVGLALLVGTVAVLVALAVRRSASPPEQRARLPADLRAALGAGRGELAAGDPPRDAVIGCYRAMERSLAGAGTRRSVADTPTDLLEAAVASGLVRSDAAGTLTDLFRLVRFSDRPVPPGSVQAAVRALDELDAEIVRALDARAADRARHGSAAPTVPRRHR